MAGRDQQDPPKRSRRDAGLPAGLTLRFGSTRLHGRVDWPQPSAAHDRLPLIVLLTDSEHATRAQSLGASLCTAAAGVVLSIPTTDAPRHLQRSAKSLEAAALGWAAEHALELGADPHMLAVAGVGVAGAHAARLAVTARDQGWPALCRQLLVRPTFTAGWLIPPDLAAVAPATIVTSSTQDRDAAQYAALLRAAGVEVEELRPSAGNLPSPAQLRALARSLRTERTLTGRGENPSAIARAADELEAHRRSQSTENQKRSRR